LSSSIRLSTEPYNVSPEHCSTASLQTFHTQPPKSSERKPEKERRTAVIFETSPL
jgi:hypothetical protein